MNEKIVELRNARWTPLKEFLVGDAYGHPSFPDGRQVRTSRVQSGPDADGLVRTCNTTYRVTMAEGA